MDERVVQFRVGVVVLATLIITAILVLLFNDAPAIVGRHYMIYIDLPKAPGIAVDSPVRRSGIRIGRVRQIKFTEGGHVLITAAVEEDVKLGRNEVCRVTGTLLGGNSSLDFSPSDDPQLAAQQIEPDSLIHGLVSADPLEMLADLQDNMTGTVETIRLASEQVTNLAKRVDDLLSSTDDRQIADLLKRADQAFEGIAATTDSLNAVLGDPQVQHDLKESLAQIPQLLMEARDMLVSVHSAVDSVQENLNGLIGPAMTKAINDELDQLSDILAQVQIFATSLNNSEGTLGRLINDPELYENANSIVRTIEQLSTRLRPIIDDVRVFTDKIARDPGRLGVRGAMRRPSGIK
ncbi:MAG: MlaD family protein [Pirellulales bacterium]